MKISALDESGKPVDWWFAYKVPKLGRGKCSRPSLPGTVTSAIGYEYVYYDPTVAKIDMSKFLRCSRTTVPSI